MQSFNMAQTKQQLDARAAGVELDLDAMRAVRSLFVTMNALRNYLETTPLREHRLSMTAFCVLSCVWQNQAIETRKIADQVGISKATLTGVLGTLENRSLLKRVLSDKDRRLVLVEVTDQGDQLMKNLFAKVNEHEAKATHKLSSQQLQNLSALLDVLRESINQL